MYQRRMHSRQSLPVFSVELSQHIHDSFLHETFTRIWQQVFKLSAILLRKVVHDRFNNLISMAAPQPSYEDAK